MSTSGRPIHLTEHAIARGWQRLHLSPGWLAAKAAHVHEHGQRLETYDGPLRAYLDRTQRLYPASDLRINGRELWVFRCSASLTALITIATIPRPFAEHLKRVAKAGPGPPCRAPAVPSP